MLGNGDYSNILRNVGDGVQVDIDTSRPMTPCSGDKGGAYEGQ